MGCDQKKALTDFATKSDSIFSEFMLRIAKFEEHVDIAHRLLIGFYQELEIFRKPQVYKTSQVVDHIIEVNQTERMKTYVDAGSRHQHQVIQNIFKLYSCKRGLQEHIMKVKILLDELDCLKEDAVDIAWQANNCATPFFETRICDEESVLEEVCSDGHKEEVELMHLADKPASYVALMVGIYNMFRLDYTMQENIVNCVEFTAPNSDQLESYCLMWNLRPYIDDKFVHQCWKRVP